MRAKRGSILEARISDGSGILTLTFFNQSLARMNELRPGVRGIFAGKMGEYNAGAAAAHPDYELFEPDAELARGGGPQVRRTADPALPGHVLRRQLAAAQVDRGRARHPGGAAGPGPRRRERSNAACSSTGARWN